MKKIIFLFIIAIATHSCSNNSETNNESVESSEYSIKKDFKYSSNEVFTGLFFNTGRFAHDLPIMDSKFTQKIYSRRSSEELKKIEDFQKLILEKIDNKDPKILKSFSESIQSGNPYVIEDGFNTFYNHYFETLKTIPEFSKFFEIAEKNYKKLNIKDYLLENGDVNEEKLFSDLNEQNYLNPNRENISNNLILVCFTMVILNIGVVLNAAAAVNAAVGVNIAFAINAAAATNVTFSHGYSRDNINRKPSRISEELILQIINATR